MLATLARHLRSVLVISISPWFVVPRGLRAAMLRAAGWRVAPGAEIQFGSCFRAPDVTIGSGGFISNGCLFEGQGPIVLGDRVFLSSRVHIASSAHALGPEQHRCAHLRNEPVVIGNGVWLGAGATVLAGVTIGEGCVVAAGAVVTKDCAPNGLYAGLPAVRKRDLDPDLVGDAHLHGPARVLAHA